LIASVFTFAFYASYLKIKNYKIIITTLMIVVFPYCFTHWYFQLTNFFLYVPTLLLTLSMAVIGYLHFYRTRIPSDFVWPSLMALMVVLGAYDASLAGSGNVWRGNDFYLALFNGFFYCLAFLLTFGVRALRAFTDLSKVNATLEQRIAETRAELAKSEAARQELIVGRALAGERERLMQEMHDGIGSNLITALGLGLGIDYALLMVNRFREERARGLAVKDAATKTMETAGRTVFFSGLTVAVVLASMVIFPQYFLRSFAYAGVGVVVVAVFGALVALPAMLALLGDRVNKLKVARIR
jgi:hypothetical protein